MIRDTDVFIIGGGPAGLAAAIAARERGFVVTVADGARPPINKACGEGLMPDTLSALQGLGVNLSASDGAPFRGIRFWGRNIKVEADFPNGQGIGIPRTALHQILLRRASGIGVRFLWDTPVIGVRSNGALTADRIVSARWIIGADGAGSRVRKWCGLEDCVSSVCRYATRGHYRVPPWTQHAEVYWGATSQAYVTPVGEQSVCVVLISRRRGFRLSSLRDEFPALAARLKNAERIGAERGAVTLTRQLKNIYRGTVALVGDASGSVDAITGDGLNLSFQQASALAAALEAGDLRMYQQAHRRLARRPGYMARLLLLLDAHATLRDRTLAALAAHPEIFSRILRIHVGAASSMELASVGTLLGWRLVTT
jgi:menaquinone-9 beta-reductase